MFWPFSLDNYPRPSSGDRGPKTPPVTTSGQGKRPGVKEPGKTFLANQRTSVHSYGMHLHLQLICPALSCVASCRGPGCAGSVVFLGVYPHDPNN